MDSSTGIKQFDLLSLPLTGRTLIEASAGTGKTYSIAFIYLRLLLGLGDNCFPKKLKVDEILVVTFTQAATEELRSRIRKNIYELRAALAKGSHDESVYQQLIELIDDAPVAIQILTEALASMDEAAIYTIHSFCQRILTTYAFESGIVFEQKLVSDEYSLRLQMVQHFWRTYFTPLEKPLAYLILQSWSDPVALLNDLMPYFHLDSSRLLSQKCDIVLDIKAFYQTNIEKIIEIKQLWLAYCELIYTIISESDVSKQSYSSRHLPNWLQKISDWANSETIDFSIPPALHYFSQAVLISKTKPGKAAPTHFIFEKIEHLLACPLDLSTCFLEPIAGLVHQAIHEEKVRRSEMGFDDLLLLLNRALSSPFGSQLAVYVHEKYPLAMIDEFQDTDPVQYAIFDRIYENNKQIGLLFIGDPKQAIYSFRGADIFTYLQAKQSSNGSHYTMDTNWRSSNEMVMAVNALFSSHALPFIFEDIPFVKMKAADSNNQKTLKIGGNPISAFCAYMLPDENYDLDNYLQQMAICCANDIVKWLSGDALLINSLNESRHVTAADIAILVRNKKEAQIIQQQLLIANIQSVYLSNHNSVFDSDEAKEVLLLLKAILSPENERDLSAALMTQLIGLPMSEIETILYDQARWENLVEEFKWYQTRWSKYGVLVVLRYMMKKRNLAENILAKKNGERILTNFMHLGELLQEASYSLDSEHALIRWLTRQIHQPDPNVVNHEQRLESDEELVKIITIHKSKGLEFPLVWLPFMMHSRQSSTRFYHDPKNHYHAKYAWIMTDDIKQQIEKERLAEDLRLLYVAITRSVYHCSIGLAHLNKQQSALHYLLSNDLSAMGAIADVIIVKPNQSLQKLNLLPIETQSLTAKKFTRRLATNWRVTSYSELQQGTRLSEDFLSLAKQDNDYSQVLVNTKLHGIYDCHHFPSGAYVGTLLHKIMENINLTNIDELSINMINQLGLSLNWQMVVTDWLKNILSIPLTDKQLSLEQFLQGNCMQELKFYLPIKQSVTAYQLDRLCKKYDRLSQRSSKLDFPNIKGMLTGVIDLVFEHDGKFYLIDYKSNKLGDDIDAYQQHFIDNAMIDHRYDLQYQFYTLALHRFLKTRLRNYQYSKHIGGVYYLFLRGAPFGGIFYHLPEEQFIESLDLLFE